MLRTKDLRFNIWLTCFFALFSIVIIGEASAKTLYVDMESLGGTCNDSYTYTKNSKSQPFCTIQRAADVVVAGDTVIVKDGTYTDSVTCIDGTKCAVYITRGGGIGGSGNDQYGHNKYDPSTWVTFKAENDGGSVIDGVNNKTWICVGIKAGVDYVQIEGFEIKGCKSKGIVAYNPSNDIRIHNNHFHDIGRVCSDDDSGYGALYSTSQYITFDSNVVHDNGRYQDGENGCWNKTHYWQNHDHALYINDRNNKGADHVVVTNNIFYNNPGGWMVNLDRGTDNAYVINNTFYGGNLNRDGVVKLHALNDGVDWADLDNHNIIIQNNIFYNPTKSGILGSEGTLATSDFSNNVVYGSPYVFSKVNGGSYNSSFDTITIDNNSNLIGQDLLFVNAPYDFHLASNKSRAVDAGLSTYAPSYDIDGNGRPVDGDNDGIAKHDIGAYEFGGEKITYSAPTPTPGPISNPTPAPPINPAKIVDIDPFGTYIDAENFTGSVNQETGSFVLETSQPGFIGTGYLLSTGVSGGDCLSKAGKEYKVNFPTTGTYNVWVKGYSTSSSGDSIFIGLDGNCVGSLYDSLHNHWNWLNYQHHDSNTITVQSAGIHTLNIWVREPNFLIDGIYVTEGTEFPPDDIALLDNIPPAPPYGLIIN